MMQWTELATKADVGILKADLQTTKMDLETKLRSLEMRLRQGLVSKEDLRTVQRKLVLEIFKTNGRIDSLENRLIARMDAGFDRVMKTVDSFAGKLEIYGRETLTTPKTLDEHGRKLKEHEHRLIKLESSQH